MLVCTFSTRPIYKSYGEYMLGTFQAVGIQGVLYEYPDLNNWDLNVKYKPRAILRAMDEHPDEDVLFMDADARAVNYPSLLVDGIQDFDVAAYHDAPHRPCGGTVWFHRTRGRKYVAHWIMLNEERKDALDDWDNLQAVFWEQRTNHGGRIYHLPPAYCWIERDMRRRFPTAEPVIEHFTIGDHQSYTRAVNK